VLEQKGLCWLCDRSGNKGVVRAARVLRLSCRAAEGVDRESNADCRELKIRC